MMLKSLIFTALILFILAPQTGSAQTINKRASNGSTEEQKWRPINKFKNHQNLMQVNPSDPGTPTLTNVLNGVSFYSMKSNCNSEKTLLLKLINSNNYPVKVSWKMSPTSPEVVVLIPASSEQVGSCSNANLIVKKPIDAEKDDIIKYALSHLHIIKAEK